MKSGHAAGLVAGFIAGIADIIFGGILAQLYVWEFPMSVVLELLPFTATVHTGVNVVYGVIFGILFAKLYDVIPGKSGFRKGVFWGLIYAIVPTWWITSYYLAYGAIPMTLVWLICGLVVIIFYGPPLGYLYEGSQQPVKAEDKRKYKPIAGVIAGLVSGIVAAVLLFIHLSMEIPFFWYYPVDVVPATLITNVVAIGFVLSVIWGIIFGAIFALLYARLPGKNVMKGIYYGLLLFLLSTIFGTIWGLAYGADLQMEFSGLIMGVLAFISYGMVLGYFYKK